MKENKRGSVINISFTESLRGQILPGRPVRRICIYLEWHITVVSLCALARKAILTAWDV